jgi:hypothetical protein
MAAQSQPPSPLASLAEKAAKLAVACCGVEITVSSQMIVK